MLGSSHPLSDALTAVQQVWSDTVGAVHTLQKSIRDMDKLLSNIDDKIAKANTDLIIMKQRLKWSNDHTQKTMSRYKEHCLRHSSKTSVPFVTDIDHHCHR